MKDHNKPDASPVALAPLKFNSSDLISCLWYFADGQLNFAVTLDRINNFLRQRAVAKGETGQVTRLNELQQRVVGYALAYRKAPTDANHRNLYEASGALLENRQVESAAQPAGTLEQVRERTLEEVAQWLEVNHIDNEDPEWEACCNLPKRIRALGAVPQVQQGQGKGHDDETSA